MGATCRVWLKDRKRSTDLMLMFGLNETIDQLAMVNNVYWFGHVLKIKDGHALRRALGFEADGQRKKGRPKRKWKKQAKEACVKVEMRRGDAPYRSK